MTLGQKQKNLKEEISDLKLKVQEIDASLKALTEILSVFISKKEDSE